MDRAARLNEAGDCSKSSGPPARADASESLGCQRMSADRSRPAELGPGQSIAGGQRALWESNRKARRRSMAARGRFQFRGVIARTGRRRQSPPCGPVRRSCAGAFGRSRKNVAQKHHAFVFNPPAWKFPTHPTRPRQSRANVGPEIPDWLVGGSNRARRRN